jgi:hypothetical protein
MWRSGTITERRYKSAFDELADWASDVHIEDLDTERSKGPVTARAVILLRKLDREIHRRTDQEHSLDDVVERLVEEGEGVDLARFREVVEAVIGEPSETLEDAEGA